MKIPLTTKVIDERFFDHRRRSTSIAGVASAAAALSLFLFRLLHDHSVNLDLLLVGGGFVLVKFGMLIWYRFTD